LIAAPPAGFLVLQQTRLDVAPHARTAPGELQVSACAGHCAECLKKHARALLLPFHPLQLCAKHPTKATFRIQRMYLIDQCLPIFVFRTFELVFWVRAGFLVEKNCFFC